MQDLKLPIEGSEVIQRLAKVGTGQNPVGWWAGEVAVGEAGTTEEIPWPRFYLPFIVSHWPNLAGCLQSRQRGWDRSKLQKAKPSRVHFWRDSQVPGAVWLPDAQCPLLTFLMSSERKHRAYFTDGGCFTHRGCFTV